MEFYDAYVIHQVSGLKTPLVLLYDSQLYSISSSQFPVIELNFQPHCDPHPPEIS